MHCPHCENAFKAAAEGGGGTPPLGAVAIERPGSINTHSPKIWVKPLFAIFYPEIGAFPLILSNMPK